MNFVGIQCHRLLLAAATISSTGSEPCRPRYRADAGLLEMAIASAYSGRDIRRSAPSGELGALADLPIRLTDRRLVTLGILPSGGAARKCQLDRR